MFSFLIYTGTRLNVLPFSFFPGKDKSIWEEVKESRCGNDLRPHQQSAKGKDVLLVTPWLLQMRKEDRSYGCHDNFRKSSPASDKVSPKGAGRREAMNKARGEVSSFERTSLSWTNKSWRVCLCLCVYVHKWSHTDVYVNTCKVTIILRAFVRVHAHTHIYFILVEQR